MRQPGDGAEDETHRGERSRCVRSCQTPYSTTPRLTSADDGVNVAFQREAFMSRFQRSVACISIAVALMVFLGTQPAPGQAKPGARKLDLAHIIPPPESGA